MLSLTLGLGRINRQSINTYDLLEMRLAEDSVVDLNSGRRHGDQDRRRKGLKAQSASESTGFQKVDAFLYRRIIVIAVRGG